TVEPLLRLSARPRVLGVHVEAVCTAVDLRSAHLEQVHELFLDAAFADELLQPKHCMIGARNGADVQACLHLVLPSCAKPMPLPSNRFIPSNQGEVAHRGVAEHPTA